MSLVYSADSVLICWEEKYGDEQTFSRGGKECFYPPPPTLTERIRKLTKHFQKKKKTGAREKFLGSLFSKIWCFLIFEKLTVLAVSTVFNCFQYLHNEWKKPAAGKKFGNRLFLRAGDEQKIFRAHFHFRASSPRPHPQNLAITYGDEQTSTTK